MAVKHCSPSFFGVRAAHDWHERNIPTQPLLCRERHQSHVVRAWVEYEGSFVDDLLDSGGVCCSNACQVATIVAWASERSAQRIPGRDRAGSTSGTVAVLSGL